MSRVVWYLLFWRGEEGGNLCSCFPSRDAGLGLVMIRECGNCICQWEIGIEWLVTTKVRHVQERAGSDSARCSKCYCQGFQWSISGRIMVTTVRVLLNRAAN